VTSCYTDARYIDIYLIVGRSCNVKGLTSLWSVLDMCRHKKCGISQLQLLYGRLPIDILGVEIACDYMKLSGFELINQRKLVLRR